MLPASLKDCIGKINNNEPVFDSLCEAESRIRQMQFIGAYHILKEVIEELHEENTIPDMFCSLKISDNDGTYMLYVRFESKGGTDEQWEIFNENDSLIEDLSYWIQSSDSRAFGELNEGEYSFKFSEKELPDLDSLILSPKNKAAYQSALLELELGTSMVSKSKTKI